MKSTRFARAGVSASKVGRRYASTQQHHVTGSSARPEERPQPESADDSTGSSGSVVDSGSSAITGSAKLFADALREEESSGLESSSSSSNSKAAARLVQAHTEENWTGEESVRDAVLRMLVDKYKPLRGPVVRSAEEKIRERPPVVRDSPHFTSSASAVSEASTSARDVEYRPDWQTRAAEPLLPAVEGHRPWHTTFTPPVSTARIKAGSFAPSSARRSAAIGSEDTVKQDIGAARRSATAQRLGRARESTLDYRLGLSKAGENRREGEIRRPMPVGAKGWASLVEERIERARLEGQFRTLKGRGSPLVRETDERNPFIAREEFLMNRIVQRNQAAPPWVELQAEVESAIQTFRAILRTTWTRRAIRHLTASRSSSSLHSLTLADARALRDANWAAREAAYHASALDEVNELVRRYNGVAPYAVRKAYFVRDAELERAYWESGEGVLEGVRERLRKGEVGGRVDAVGSFGEEEGGGGGTGGTGGAGGLGEGERRGGIWEIVRGWFASFRA